MPATDGPYPVTPVRHSRWPTSNARPGRGGATVVFWLLLAMGLATFAPCVLLPQWRQYQALSVAEQMAQHRLDVLRSRIDKEQRLLDALRSDPAVVARFAQRDLGYRRPYEQVVKVSAATTTAAPSTTFGPWAGPIPARRDSRSLLPHGKGFPSSNGARRDSRTSLHMRPMQPPPVIAAVLSYLPDYNYDRVFCADDTRPMLMGLSVALLAVAFVLFRPRRVEP
jgi:cell division protein FtsB